VLWFCAYNLKDIDKKLDHMMQLKELKNSLERSEQKEHNNVMAHIGFMSLYQEIYQDIKDFRDQYMDYAKFVHN